MDNWRAGANIKYPILLLPELDNLRDLRTATAMFVPWPRHRQMVPRVSGLRGGGGDSTLGVTLLPLAALVLPPLPQWPH